MIFAVKRRFINVQLFKEEILSLLYQNHPDQLEIKTVLNLRLNYRI